MEFRRLENKQQNRFMEGRWFALSLAPYLAAEFAVLKAVRGENNERRQQQQPSVRAE